MPPRPTGRTRRSGRSGEPGQPDRSTRPGQRGQPNSWARRAWSEQPGPPGRPAQGRPWPGSTAQVPWPTAWAAQALGEATRLRGTPTAGAPTGREHDFSEWAGDKGAVPVRGRTPRRDCPSPRELGGPGALPLSAPHHAASWGAAFRSLWTVEEGIILEQDRDMLWDCTPSPTHPAAGRPYGDLPISLTRCPRPNR